MSSPEFTRVGIRNSYVLRSQKVKQSVQRIKVMKKSNYSAITQTFEQLQNLLILFFPQFTKQMYNFQLAQRKQQQIHKKAEQGQVTTRWLKRYHTEAKPKLLQQYGQRVKAFIRKIQQQPFDERRVLKHQSTTNFLPFRFTLSKTQYINDKSNRISERNERQRVKSIFTENQYCPISSHTFRQRVKCKQIPQPMNIKAQIYRKKQKEKLLKTHTTDKSKRKRQEMLFSRTGFRQLQTKLYEDNRSDLPSVQQDGQSLRYSNHENIEKQARQFEKKQQLYERKEHYKQLMVIEQGTKDPKIKNDIHNLLVKRGIAWPKAKTESKEQSIDIFKMDHTKEHSRH